jgi:cbb3-type cytochrome oxidase subunit 3
MAVGLLVGIGVLAWAYRRGPQPRQGKKNEDSSNFGIIDTSDVFGG